MTEHSTSTHQRPDSGTESAADHRQSSGLRRSTADENDDLARLTEAETILRAAIETLTPDAEEIKRHLTRQQDSVTSALNRQWSYRLIVAVVILVFLMLLLDLLLA